MVYTDSAIEAESVFLPFFMSSSYYQVLQVQQFSAALKSLQLGNIPMLYFH